MKHPDEPWEHGPPFDDCPPDPRPPLEEEDVHEDEPPELAAVRKIELLSRLHHMAFRSLFREEWLPPAQAGAMRVIIRSPGLSQRELADRLHIKRATATVMLQKMEKAGHIERRPDQEDQRISRIYPTETAIATDSENQKRVNDYFLRCFSEIDQESFDVMLAALGRLEENLRNILSDTWNPRKE